MSRKPGGGHGGGGGGGHDAGGGLRWLLTYADMITLLLALFIYLYSISEVNASKMAAFTAAFSKAFGIGNIPVAKGSPGINPAQGFRSGRSQLYRREPASGDGHKPGYKAPEKNPGEEAARRNLEALKEQLEREFPDWLKEGSLTMLELDEGLMLRMRDNALFDKGSASITGRAQNVLGVLATRLQPLGYPLRVEGHTDDLPIGKSAKFADNWELSSARAASVVRFFSTHGIQQDLMSLAGYGEFRPVEPNVPGQGNPINRRVEILIVAPFNAPEPDAAVGAPGETAQPDENAGETPPETVSTTPPLVFSSEPEVVPAPESGPAEHAPPMERAPTPPPPRSAAH